MKRIGNIQINIDDPTMDPDERTGHMERAAQCMRAGAMLVERFHELLVAANEADIEDLAIVRDLADVLGIDVATMIRERTKPKLTLV